MDEAYAIMRGTFEKGPIFHAPKPDIDFITALGLDPHYKHKRPDTLSFEQYFRGHYEKMICGSIQDQINAGTLKPGKGTYRIPQPDKAVCDNAYIHQMRFRSSNSATIFFQVIVITEITLFAHLGDMWVSDRRKEWYLIDGIFDTEDVDHHMTLGNIRIYRAGDEPDGQILTEYLIPWFDEQQVNDEAERILKLYIPEALEKPMRISAKLLAERMKLKVKYLHLASHDNALGLLFFRDKSIDVLDQVTGEIVWMDIAAGTIIINAQTVSRDDYEKIVETIIHECMHRIEHVPFYHLQKMYNEDIAYLACPANIDETYNDPSDPVRWIEWQAREISLCVRMPARTTRMKIDELLKEYNKRWRCGGQAWVWERLVKDLASFYGVSRYQARKRIINLGYEQAQGVLNYVNGSYVPPYSFAPGTCGKNQTYTVGFSNAFAEYQRNEKFCEILEHGHFLYVEGHFCINHPKYVCMVNDKIQMTPYGRAHVDECCLLFNVKYYGKTPKYVDGVLRSEKSSLKTEVTADLSKAELKAEQAREMGNQAVKTTRILRNLSMLFTKTLTEHMTRLNITIEELAARTGISVRSISDYRNKEDERPGLRVVVALCIGLHLEPDLSEDLIRKSGSTFMLVVEETMYKFILRDMYTSSIEECNECLVAAGFRPLIKGEKVA